MLRSKIERDPAPPHSLAPEIPAELSALCMALLSRDPAKRPSGRDVLAKLQQARPKPEDSASQRSGDTSLLTETRARGATPFFGREAELATLHNALQDARAGHSQVVHVRGISGTGKSALVEHFLDELEGDAPTEAGQPVLVLRSRCYEREAMPFKALDGVIDALTRQLSHLDDLEIGHLMPADIGSLAQLFPVLERLRAVQRLLSMRSSGGDAVHNRQRAELAFRELLGRLARRRPVVIWIDDVQWGDLDSAGILKGFLHETLELPLVLVFSYRSDEVDTSECLRVLLSAAQHERAAPTTVVQVQALPSADLATLCRAQLGTFGQGQDALVAHIVREAHGSPFLAAQLTALALAKLTRADSDVATLSLSGLVAQTAALLPADARLFLRVLAIAGRPIPPRLALRAAELRGGGREIIHALRQQLLVRTRDVAGEKLIEVYHDRVREGVQRSISDEDAEQLHRQLLHALEYSGRADPDWLYAHALGARQRLAAFRYGSAAAERAMSTLAFEHAAELYASCIELSDASDQERGELLNKLAAALACCGRGRRAADAYLEAAALSSGHEALKRMQLATSHLFRSGRFAEAEAMLQRVLVAMDVRMPQS
ncbi:MAG TPA: AAA family ATPase, partial [Polyangiales bacterium]|nr:AAA family ATPase [Polyangiales bacterium]